MTVDELCSTIEQEDLGYGSVWSEARLCEVFKIDMPDLSGNASSIIKNTDKFRQDKLNAYCSINEQLLKQGKCFIQDKDVYRVPLISEITNQITKYYNSSNRKFKRAEKLRKSFSNKYPTEAKEVNDKANRINSMRESESKAYQPMA